MDDFLEKEIRVLMPIEEIPLGSLVTKRRGENVYLVSDICKIYNENGELREIKAEDDTRFIYSNDSTTNTINVVSGSTEYLWITNRYELLEYLEDMVDDR